MVEESIHGRVWRFGDDIDTDVIIPGQYIDLDPEEYATHALEPVEPDFADEVADGDVIVAETNFGIGSSREHAVIALAVAGVGAIVAHSYGRIFYRNAINQGLPVLHADREVIDRIDRGDDVEIALFEGRLENHTTGETLEIERITEPQRSYLEAGGAVEYFIQNR